MLTCESQHVTNVARHFPSIFSNFQMRSNGDQLSLVVVEVVVFVVHHCVQSIHDQPAESAHERSNAAHRTLLF